MCLWRLVGHPTTVYVPVSWFLIQYGSKSVRIEIVLILTRWRTLQCSHSICLNTNGSPRHVLGPLMAVGFIISIAWLPV